jgi:hypothetical protein
MSTHATYLNIEHSYLYWICGKGDPLKPDAFEAVRVKKERNWGHNVAWLLDQNFKVNW